MNRISIITAALLVAGLGAGSASTWATERPGHAAFEYRESIMTVFKWYLGPMAGMAKGKIPYDQASFQHNAKELAKAASLDVLSGFPEGSIDEDSEAKPEIWQNWKKFEDKLEALRTESAKLAEIAAGGDQQATVEQFKRTAGTCGGCHDDFRED
ncbi:MAG: cytochrome c [Gammaproteobacteria bacterium]|nr:cytochrome c [Gammaproteobacteria bacterium]